MIRMEVYADQVVRPNCSVYGCNRDKGGFVETAKLATVTVCPNNEQSNNEWCVHYNATDINSVQYDIIQSISYYPAD